MSWLSQLNPAVPTWDLFLILFFIIGVIFYGMSLGRDRVLVIMVATYMGLAVVTNVPYLKEYTAKFSVNSFAIQISTFLGVFVLLFILLSRNAIIRSLDLHPGSLFQTFLFSVLHVGLLISIVFTFLPADSLMYFSEQTRSLFLSDMGRFVWLVGPIGAMMVFGRK